MGTSIQVYSRTSDAPKFGDILATAERQLRQFLEKFRITAHPVLQAYWRRGQTNLRSVELGELMTWPDNQMVAWFTVAGVPGGTDVHLRADASSIRQYLANELLGNRRFQERANEVNACAAAGRRWDFCRWGGAAAMTNVAYGILAASVATLTDGLLVSEDGAWDWQRFPATAGEFLSWWYDPRQAIEATNRTWATKCIEAIRSGKDNPNDAVL